MYHMLHIRKTVKDDREAVETGMGILGITMHSGQFLAIISAALFGVSPVLCKLVIGEMSPALLAGLLYLGSGIGLLILLLFQGKNPVEVLKRLPSRYRLALFGS